METQAALPYNAGMFLDRCRRVLWEAIQPIPKMRGWLTITVILLAFFGVSLVVPSLDDVIQQLPVALRTHHLGARLAVVLFFALVLVFIRAYRLQRQVDEAEAVESLPAPPTRGVPINLAWLVRHLKALDYPDDEIRTYRVQALLSMKYAGIMDEEAGDKFFADLTTRETLRSYYREYLERAAEKRPPGAPLVDVSGLATWGPRVHLATPVSLPLVLADLRDTLRQFREAGAE